MQLSEWWDHPNSRNDLQLAVQMIADIEALWQTSERLTHRCMNHVEKGDAEEVACKY